MSNEQQLREEYLVSRGGVKRKILRGLNASVQASSEGMKLLCAHKGLSELQSHPGL